MEYVTNLKFNFHDNINIYDGFLSNLELFNDLCTKQEIGLIGITLYTKIFKKKLELQECCFFSPKNI